MNIPAASGQGIPSLYSHASRLDFTQQHPMDAVFPGRSKLRGIRPEEIKKINYKVLSGFDVHRTIEAKEL